MRLCVVIPAYNEEAVLRQTHTEMSTILESLAQKGEIAKDSFICFVDDGSKDRTWEILQSLAQEQNGLIASSGIKLSRNCGHQNALLAGL